MKHRLRTILASLSAIFILSLNFGAAGAFPLTNVASFKSDACTGISQVDSSQDCSSNPDPIKSLTSTAVTILSIVVGALAVIMIIVSGLRYITSGGEANKVSGAKGALVAALIGLLIAAVAQLLVHFVLNQSTVISNPCPYDSSIAKDAVDSKGASLCFKPK
jgi:hypothetical protein